MNASKQELNLFKRVSAIDVTDSDLSGVAENIIRNPNNVLLASDVMVKKILYSHVGSPLHMGQEKYYHLPIAIAMNKLSIPWDVRLEIRKYLLRIIESGLLDIWTKAELDRSANEASNDDKKLKTRSKQLSLNASKTDIIYEKLYLTDLLGTFYILFFGHFLALCVCVIELTLNDDRRNFNTDRTIQLQIAPQTVKSQI